MAAPCWGRLPTSLGAAPAKSMGKSRFPQFVFLPLAHVILGQLLWLESGVAQAVQRVWLTQEKWRSFPSESLTTTGRKAQRMVG